MFLTPFNFGCKTTMFFCIHRYAKYSSSRNQKRVLLTAREDQVNIVDELDIRPQESLCALFRIVGDGLELVDGYIDLLAALFEIFENTLHGIFCVRAFDGYGYSGCSSHRVWTDGWPPMAEVT